MRDGIRFGPVGTAQQEFRQQLKVLGRVANLLHLRRLREQYEATATWMLKLLPGLVFGASSV